MIEIGARLTECKRIAGRGNWMPWINREFGWSDETARKFMRCYDLAQSRKFQQDWDLPVSSLYLLAAPSTAGDGRGDDIPGTGEGSPR